MLTITANLAKMQKVVKNDWKNVSVYVYSDQNCSELLKIYQKW